jgi:hypothetical protein
MASVERPKVRLAELVATISLGTDLGLGQPMEHVIRQTLIALRMSERLGLDESQRAVVYYSGLLAWVGCHTDAYEQAKWFGDDIALKADGFMVSDPGPRWLLSRMGAGRPPLERARLGVAFVGAARRCADAHPDRRQRPVLLGRGRGCRLSAAAERRARGSAESRTPHHTYRGAGGHRVLTASVRRWPGTCFHRTRAPIETTTAETLASPLQSAVRLRGVAGCTQSAGKG